MPINNAAALLTGEVTTSPPSRATWNTQVPPAFIALPWFENELNAVLITEPPDGAAMPRCTSTSWPVGGPQKYAESLRPLAAVPVVTMPGPDSPAPHQRMLPCGLSL